MVSNSQKNIEYLLVVYKAENLPGVDNHGKSSDPYVLVRFGENYVSQTPYIKKNLNPIWNYSIKYQSPNPISTIHFTVCDHNTVKKDVTLGKAKLELEQIDLTSPVWEGTLTLTGNQIPPPSSSFLTIRLEVQNYTNTKFIDKFFGACGNIQDIAKQMMVDKSSNLARLAFATARSQMISRKLEGSVEVEVKMGYLIVCICAEIEEADTVKVGQIELVEDTDKNIGPLQTKPTKGMQKSLDNGIRDTLDQIQFKTEKIVRDVAICVKIGFETGFVIVPLLKFELSVKVLFGIRLKATVGQSITQIQNTTRVTEYSGNEEEMKNLIYKLASRPAP